MLTVIFILVFCAGTAEIVCRNLGGNFKDFWDGARIYIFIGLGALALLMSD
jgi:hypothetical protein